MIDTILEWAGTIDGILWGPWTKIFIAAVAVYLTIRSGFFQFRGFHLVWQKTLGKLFSPDIRRDTKKMTPFQATATALASTVGMGNMAGVATALSVGGPGAIFWMWILALFSMITKAAEITLAVHYREIDTEGRVHGGPMYYIRKGLGWPFLAKLFSIGVLINSIITATLLQSHTVGRAFLKSYNLNPYIVTGAMAIVTAVVIIGGVRRIGRFCETLVPLMSVLYIGGGLIIFILNYAKIPEVFSTIFTYAFTPAPMVGGFAGATIAAAIKQGMARGMLSNEAGLGTAPMVHATASTPHPFQQGMWGIFEVFVDTIVICTITSFAILSTGVLSGGESGIELVMSAFSSVLTAGISDTFIAVSILTFCLTTQIGFFIYYETAVINVFNKKTMRYLKWFYLMPGVIFAGVADVDRIWVFANISVGVCSLPNLVAVLALSGGFFKLMQDYLRGEHRFRTERTDTSSSNYVKMP
jgi:AGCS family alanine or glycine:cation symporter